ncbi:MAG: arginine repressor [Clostridium chrysemydis]|uniref:arginine repressor n=1 Tax=Clostridium TaxID=1485 RepID=UPI002153A6F9|nr:arginine regulator [Clostridium sp. LY3-2]MCR6514538.1 arginine regulator [Clostridium sp. LY3-2]
MGNSNKSLRREAILDIIENKCIGKQDELVIELRSRGINITQATLSRDLREMNIVRKSLENKEHKYIIVTDEDVTKRCQKIFKDAVVSIFVQEYFISVNTLSGMADVVGELIDRLGDRRIAGTVASNNNILVLCRGVSAAKQIFKELNSLRL